MIFAKASQLLTKCRAATGVVVTYRRAADSVQLRCAAGQSSFLATGQDGTTVEMQTKDWICDAADLILAGRATEPLRGDRIEVSLGGQVLRYEVLPGPAGVTHTYGDHRRTKMRIHTKLARQS
jgi:hypothetical protein